MIENKPVPKSFIEPKIDDTHYVFGLGQVDLTQPLEPEGNWVKHIPPGEPQRINFETSNCTAFGTSNTVEILLNRLFNITPNYSDRALGIEAGTDPEGADPQNVYEAVRKKGLEPESMLPYDPSLKTAEDYYQPNPLPTNIVLAGIEWLKEYLFKHDWVGVGKETPPDQIKTALQYSPLGISVYAWAFDPVKQRYMRIGGDIHWTAMVYYKENDYWLIYDSYAEERPEITQQIMQEFGIPIEVAAYLKKLDWNFKFYYIKRINITKNNGTLNNDQKSAILTVILSLLTKVLQILQKAYASITGKSQGTSH